MNRNEAIYHVITAEEWEKVKLDSVYAPESIVTEGFIHCATAAQVMGVVDTFYRGDKDLKLLCIDPDSVTADVVLEDLYELGKLFPHIYGELNLEAVTSVLDLNLSEKGEFEIPEEV